MVDHLTEAILKFRPWQWLKFFFDQGEGEGPRGKALTMTMTPWNLLHGQWSKNIDHDHNTVDFAHGQWTAFDHLTTVIFEFWPWSWSKRTKFNHLTTVIFEFWPWSKIFDHLTMTPGIKPNSLKSRSSKLAIK